MQDKEKIFEYIEKLSRILQETVHDSQEIEELLAKLREEGVTLQLNFVAMISGKSVNFNVSKIAIESDDDDDDDTTVEELRFEISDEDRKFLETLGISYE